VVLRIRRFGEEAVMDLLYVAVIVGFFAVSVALAYGFEKLRGPR
jgi:hypothetical protein